MSTMVLFFTSLFFSLAIGVPIYLCLGIGALILLWATTGSIPFEIIGQTMLIGIDSFPLLAIPFFVLAGELMNTDSISGKLIEFTKAIVGRVRGGLAMVGVGTSIFFSGITGYASADTAAVGSALIPAMKKDGYPTAFSAGVIAAAGSIGPIIPPSIPLIIYGVISEVSIEKLFVAGYVPGLLMGLFFLLYIYYTAKKHNFPTGTKISLKQFVLTTRKALPTLLLPIIIMGGITSGVFTATESAGYAFLLSVIVYREINWKHILSLFGRAALTSSVMIFDSFVDKLVEKLKLLKVGDPLDEKTDMGSIINAKQYHKVCAYIEEAVKDEDITVILGGLPSSSGPLAEGYFLEPTIVICNHDKCRVAKEEVFGPVLIIIPWEDEKEVIQMANRTDYGLAAFIWTQDATRALQTANELEAGWVQINRGGGMMTGHSYGGYKQSGIGREYSLESMIESFTQTKSIIIDFNR